MKVLASFVALAFLACAPACAAGPEPDEGPVFVQYWEIHLGGKKQSEAKSAEEAEKLRAKYEKIQKGSKSKKPVTVEGPITRARVSGLRDIVESIKDLVKDFPGGEEAIEKWIDENYPEAGLLWGSLVSAEFRKRVREIAKELGVDPNHLMAIMAFETGASFKPGQKNNAGSSAVGLIQFMPDTATELGTSTAALAGMTAVQQLDYVLKYFQNREKAYGELQSLDDLYMAVLYPAVIGKPGSHVVFDKDKQPTAYGQNSGLDKQPPPKGDGKITRDEIAATIRRIYEDRLRQEVRVR